jgi:hypothetical protein
VGNAQVTAGEPFGEVSLADGWNGTEWKSQTTPDLSISTNNLAGVSCASSTMCLAAGKNQIKAQPLLELWNGSEWSTSVWPNPTVPYDMTDVACTSATACVVIGTSETALRAWKVKEEGGTWALTGETLPTPSGGSQLILRSISCSSATACTAVGNYYQESEKTYKLLVERWNGTSWALQSAPNPPAGASNTTMMSVSCASATSCVTAGKSSALTVAESWNGTSWSVMTTPSPGTSENALEDISCNSSSACIATGLYKETGSGQFRKPLAERWNGTTWSVLSVPNPAGAERDVTLKGVSCQATSSCTAVGKYSYGKVNNVETKTLAEYWDGAKWTVQASPSSSLKANALASVSCTSAIACTAVGNAQVTAGEPFGEVSLAQRYE